MSISSVWWRSASSSHIRIGAVSRSEYHVRPKFRVRTFAIPKTDLFSYCRWFGDVAIFAGASGLWGCIADVGGHTETTLIIWPVLKSNITAGFRHDVEKGARNRILGNRSGECRERERIIGLEVHELMWSAESGQLQLQPRVYFFFFFLGL